MKGLVFVGGKRKEKKCMMKERLTSTVGCMKASMDEDRSLITCRSRTGWLSQNLQGPWMERQGGEG